MADLRAFDRFRSTINNAHREGSSVVSLGTATAEEVLDAAHDLVAEHNDLKTQIEMLKRPPSVSPAIKLVITEIKAAGGYERSNLDKAYFIPIDHNPGRLRIHESWIMKLAIEGHVLWVPATDTVHVGA